MTVTLYTTADDKRKVGKTLTQLSSVGATATDPCDVLHPRLLLSGGAGVNAINANYCYISTFGRYYFISGYTTDSAGRITITCDVDVLHTYASAIKGTTQLVTRSESVNGGKPTEIDDPLYPLKKSKEMFCIKFEGGQMNLATATNSSYNFVMNVAGGAGS